MTVVSLKGQPIVPPGTPNQELIKELERLTEMAASGEIDGLTYVILYRDDLTNYGWKGRTTRGMLGCLELMKHDLIAGHLENT
jgi:hypothetical protein